MRITLNSDSISEGIDINHNKIVECDIPDTVIVDLFDRYQDLKTEYDNWLLTDEPERLKQGGYNVPSFQEWVYEWMTKEN